MLSVVSVAATAENGWLKMNNSKSIFCKHWNKLSVGTLSAAILGVSMMGVVMLGGNMPKASLPRQNGRLRNSVKFLDQHFA